MPFEKKSVDIGFAPVNEVLKAVPILWCEIWKKSEAAEKKHLVELGSILKLELECLLGIKETNSSQYLFLLAYTDISTMLGGIFLVFHFLKKIYSVSTTVILNKVIIFTAPLTFFGDDIFWLSKINVKAGSKIPWAENSGQISFMYGALPLNIVCDSTLLRYVCRTVLCTIRWMKGAEINKFSN